MKTTENLYKLGTEDADTRFEMDMMNIDAFEENLRKQESRQVSLPRMYSFGVPLLSFKQLFQMSETVYPVGD